MFIRVSGNFRVFLTRCLDYSGVEVQTQKGKLMSSINLDGPNPDLAIVGAKIAQQSAKTIASVVTQTVAASQQIASSSTTPAAGPGKGQNVDTYA